MKGIKTLKGLGIVFAIFGIGNTLTGIMFIIRPLELNINSKIFGMNTLMLGVFALVLVFQNRKYLELIQEMKTDYPKRDE